MTIDNLKTIRAIHGLTLKQAARKIGISESYMCLIEHGRKPGTDALWIRIRNLYKLTDRQLNRIRRKVKWEH